MSVPVINADLANDNLTAMIGLGGLLENATLHLFSDNVQMARASVPANFTECIFSGYAAATPTWQGPFSSGTKLKVIGGLEVFEFDGIADAQECWGWFLKDAGGTKILAGQTFDSAVNLAEAGDTVEVIPGVEM